MNKIIIGVGILAVIAIGWFLLGNSTVEYAATVDDEVTQLENELASLEAEVNAGALSPEDAAKAQAQIVARIDAIHGAAIAGQKAQLTDAQRVQLIDGLERLKQALIKYKETLVAVDGAVLELPEADRPKLNRRGGGGGNRNSVAAVANEAIETVDDQVEEIIDDIVDEEIAEEVNDNLSDDVLEEDISSTTDEVIENGDEMIGDETTEDDEVDGTTEEDGSETTEESDPATTSEDFIFNETEIEVGSPQN